MSPGPGAGRLGATYRLQLRPGFGFAEAASVAGYLADLGVELAYLSPIAEAVPGSIHGYDGTDPTTLRGELGARAGFERLVEALHAVGLGVLLDIVPNHLATWPGGPWWGSVLRLGRDSPYAPVFDISWEQAGGKVVLPVLGAPLAEVLEGRSEPRLAVRAPKAATGAEPLVLAYGDLELPLAPDSASEGDDVGALLERQHYRLAWWKEPGARNYRRFFDIDGLVGVRVEDPAVFAQTHALVAELLERGAVDGLRVDHVDGLADPTSYLRRLAELAGERPIVVEKILGRDEQLPAEWPVAGTTGYEAIDDVTGALADLGGLRRLAAQSASEGDRPIGAVIRDSKRLVASTLFSAELERAAELLELPGSRLDDVAVDLPVYRTYASAEGMPERDRELLAGLPSVDDHTLSRLCDVTGHLEGIARFQQATGPVAAKGVEDTAWYRLAEPFVFLEVGGDPERIERPDDGAAVLHGRAASRVAAGSSGLVPGTTHDTKRAEDARSRLIALSEHADDFAEGLAELERLLGPVEIPGPPVSAFELRSLAETVLAVAPCSAEPDAAGAWGELAERLDVVVEKAIREAKRHTSWAEPDPGYESALLGTARQLVAAGGEMLGRAFGSLPDELARLGAVVSLSSVVLRSVLPGWPDCYQGDESWNRSLVDPDNRRPVDFAAAVERLGHLDAWAADLPAPPALARLDELRRAWPDGTVKTHVLHRCLAARRAARAACAPGAAWVPVAPGEGGEAADCLVAAARLASDSSAVAVAFVTRFPGRLDAAPGDLPVGRLAWAGTAVALPDPVLSALDRLGSRRCVDLLSGVAHTPSGDGGLPVGDVLGHLPAALLVDEASAGRAAG